MNHSTAASRGCAQAHSIDANSVKALPSPPSEAPRTRSLTIERIAAYAAGTALMAASAALNVRYALGKSDDPAMQVVWAAVAAAASIALAISPSAVVQGLAQRKYGAALVAAIAALIFGAYSVTAALGSATGGRLVAAIEADDVSVKRVAALGTIRKSEAELASIGMTRSTATIGAEVNAIHARTPGLGDCAPRPNWTPTKLHREACKAIAALGIERANAERRHELDRQVTEAHAVLAGLKAGKSVANADALALQGFAAALGVSASAETWDRVLVVLAVLIVEFGGGLAFALAQGPGSVTAGRSPATGSEGRNVEAAREGPSATVEPLQAATPCQIPTPLKSLPGPENRASDSVPPGVTSSAVVLDIPEAVGDRLVALVRDRGGELVGGLRTFGRALGVSHTEVSRVLVGLTAAGRVEVEAGRSGTRVRCRAT